MLTRRNFFEQALAVPLAAGLNANPGRPSPGFDIVSEPNCLSKESAAGFRSLTADGYSHTRNITLLCATSTISMLEAVRLRDRAASGRWIVWEISPLPRNPQNFTMQCRIVRDLFGIVLCEPIHLSPDPLRNVGLYARYRWPHAALIRTFSAVVPIACSDAAVIAHYGSTPVAMKRRIGRGGIVFLGSMLGPNIRAEELEAQIITNEMLRSLT